MSTKLIRSLYNLSSLEQGGIATIGNFDGVHVGHQQLIAKVVETGRNLGIPSTVITFEPHPFEFFAGDRLTIPRLTRLREKFSFIAECNVNNVLILPFNQKLAKLSASDFIKKILVSKLRIQHLIVGEDFHFGHNREGDIQLLQKMGREFGFTVETFETILVDGERVSSTRVRKALAEGDHQRVNRLLGHPYTMCGRVQRGDQRGRQWGFPTANLFVHRKLTPVRGVYTVYMRGIASHPWPGVANIGIRPTIDGTRTILEVHLLDFNQDIYGQYVQVEFCEKLREEIRYPTLEALKEQIAKDVVVAQQYFKKHGVI